MVVEVVVVLFFVLIVDVPIRKWTIGALSRRICCKKKIRRLEKNKQRFGATTGP